MKPRPFKTNLSGPLHGFRLQATDTILFDERNSLRVKLASLTPPLAAVALLTAALFAVATLAQAPDGAPGGAPRHYPAPTNLKVLPKDTTGKQVRVIMEGWAGQLGVHCDTCHTADPKNIGPNGKPRLKFADDSKQQKDTARLMYKMVQDINDNTVSMVTGQDGKPAPPVTCGTCHRGHLDPRPYVVPKEKRPAWPPMGEGAPAS